MNPNWHEVALSDIGRIVGGATPSTKNPDFYDGDIIWITPKDLSGFNERKISKGARTITQEGYDSCSTSLLPKGSILFSSRAPIGYVAIAGCELCTNQGFKSIVPDKTKIDEQFLFYALKFNAPKIESMASGTTFKEVSGALMKKIRIKCPEDISDQRKIANILSCFDDKIELNHQIIDVLDEIASTLYTDKFGCFEPNGIISDVCSVTDGVHNSVEDDPTGEYFLLSCKNIKNGAVIISSNERKISKDTFDQLRKRTKLDVNDILLSSVGTIGELALVIDKPNFIEFQRSVAILKPTSGVSQILCLP